MKRIQIQLTGKRLSDVVDEMAAESGRAVAKVMKTKERDTEVRQAIAKATRRVLEKYVHAYDVCGLAAVCQEAQEVNAWELKDQDKD